MNPRSLPGISAVLDYGPENRVYDALLLLGPPLILLIVLAEVVLPEEVTVLVRALAAAYLAVFVGYVAYRGIQ